jgi:hypothetical protein
MRRAAGTMRHHPRAPIPPQAPARESMKSARNLQTSPGTFLANRQH